MPNPEEIARADIDAALGQAGWAVQGGEPSPGRQEREAIGASRQGAAAVRGG
ncbi:MAG: hypothetical protein QJR03_04675 [Sphaerobacter sp.]|nr:hypothetical protein [Sphaerobacter sp.]